jgi:hypothetical protein
MVLSAAAGAALASCALRLERKSRPRRTALKRYCGLMYREHGKPATKTTAARSGSSCEAGARRRLHAVAQGRCSQKLHQAARPSERGRSPRPSKGKHRSPPRPSSGPSRLHAFPCRVLVSWIGSGQARAGLYPNGSVSTLIGAIEVSLQRQWT